jgi:hypothetical protein
MDLDTGATPARRRREGAFPVRAETVKDALDVLARAKTVQPKIMASARILAAPQGTDLDDVVAAAVRSNPIGAEERLLRFEGLDIDDLGLPTPPPTIDLVGVGAQPALEGRPLLNDGAGRLGAPRCSARGQLHDRFVVGRPNRIGVIGLGRI